MENRKKKATGSKVSEDDAGIDTLLKTSDFLKDKASRVDVPKGVADPKTSSQTVEKLAPKKKPNPSLPRISEVSEATRPSHKAPKASRYTKSKASRDSPSKDVPLKRKKTNVEKEGDIFESQANVGSSSKRSKKQPDPKSNPEPKTKPAQAKPTPKAKPASKAKPSQAPRYNVENQEKELKSNMHPPRVHYKHKQAAKTQVESHPSGKSKQQPEVEPSVKHKSTKRKTSDSFAPEEEKVETVKKVTDVANQKDKGKNILEGESLKHVKKEHEPGNDSESSFQKGKRRRKQKGPTEAQIKKDLLDKEYPSMRSRVVPLSLFKAIRDAKVNMNLFLDSIGFGSLHGINFETIPGRLGRLVVKLFDSKEGT